MSTVESQDYVRIFDTTLRDGEQSPGASMTSEEKLEIARALSRLGVDVIEAGFPASSPDDFAAVRAIAERIGRDPVPGRPQAEPPIVCGLARATKNDIERAYEAVKVAMRPRIHTFLSTSPIHREHKLRMTKEQVIERVREMVARARELCEDVEFSAEDAGRTEPEYLWEVASVAIAAGATTINLPDTVGYLTPFELHAMIAGVKKNAVGVDRVILSVHCHDDLGLGVANTLAGLEAGARQAELTINGIGERAGNAALEEVVMALAVRRDRMNLRTGIDPTQITRTSRLVSAHTGMLVPPNKAIVGANAFAHESGIHQDGLLKHEKTYEILKAEDVGASGTRLVLGKHSGRHALEKRLAELGVTMDQPALDQAFSAMKALADRKKHVTDADLLALVSSERREELGGWRLEALQISAGTQGMPTATVRLRGEDGRDVTQAAVGTGPVHACFRAIDAVVDLPVELLEYTVHAVTEGIDALGEVSVRVRDASGGLHAGYGADTDVLVASAKAYLAALDRARKERVVAKASEQARLKESA
ncbi:2-isopropylmalate synthase [Sandaracinus amylolyticus]|uniref:2-isopropylmalate synthase n=1 Tax=Sandaracinus amylolyticus TaxID=927083 RepID=A0A0F6YK85_9BACT|nr:2-isopropylmalate synthase [Sandaracinus amylolyticus]AKF08060.1 2-isopropylmalate synthase [Sandaracinus amylolyticus]